MNGIEKYIQNKILAILARLRTEDMRHAAGVAIHQPQDTREHPKPTIRGSATLESRERYYVSTVRTHYVLLLQYSIGRVQTSQHRSESSDPVSSSPLLR